MSDRCKTCGQTAPNAQYFNSPCMDEWHENHSTSVHDAIREGIERGLRDFGATLTGCTASSLTGHVINNLKAAGALSTSGEVKP